MTAAVDPVVLEEVAEYDDETRQQLDELGKIAEQLADVETLYARRSEILVALRQRDRPVKYRILAAFSRSTEEAMLQAYRKATKS